MVYKITYCYLSGEAEIELPEELREIIKGLKGSGSPVLGLNFLKVDKPGLNITRESQLKDLFGSLYSEDTTASLLNSKTRGANRWACSSNFEVSCSKKVIKVPYSLIKPSGIDPTKYCIVELNAGEKKIYIFGYR